MKATGPKAQLEEIPEADCLEIVEQHSLGRIAAPATPDQDEISILSVSDLAHH